MKVTRIVNRGRIAPNSPKPIIDSGRNSWSTASIVSTIDTQSPEPNLAQQVNQKLQQTVLVTPLKKKIIIGASIAAICILIIGIVAGTTLSHTSNKPSPDVISPLLQFSTNTTTSTTATTETTTTATTTTATTATTTTVK